MRGRLAWLAGGAGLAAAVLARRFRRQRSARVEHERAEELRHKLAESRTLLAERDEFEAAETPVDRAEAVDERRRRVHDAGRATADEMRDVGRE